MQLFIKFIFFCTCIKISSVYGFRCDRRPYGTTSQSSAPDGRFKLTVLGTENTYIPDQVYTVQISDTDGESQFVGFMISAEGDVVPAPGNTRRLISNFPGEIRPQNEITAKFSERCVYSVEHASISLKSSVEAYWKAPPSGNGCVTFRAMVAENEDTWYEDGSPLTQKICEDIRQPDEMSPTINMDCQICDEAKYEVRFTGMWSRNTHPQMYPENDWIPRYSDLVGASHSADYILWAPGSLVSNGFKDLAEHANSSILEGEIFEKVGDGVRTMIKGKGHGHPKMSNPTYSIFRTDKVNHLISAAVALYPSPDWFLGVSKFELCQPNNMWLPERELNLFPWDAGTDNGVSYESLNVETYPQDTVSRVQMSSYDKNSPFYEIDMKDMHPFGTLSIKLIKTYHRTCEETSEAGEVSATEETENKEDEKSETPDKSEPEPSRYHYPEISTGAFRGEGPIKADPESTKKCPMTEWTDWSSCEGACVDGTVSGYKWRERYHMENGIAMNSKNWRHSIKSPPESCTKLHQYFQHVECEEECTEVVPDDDDNIEEEEATVERRVMSPVLPGTPWSKKREANLLLKLNPQPISN